MSVRSSLFIAAAVLATGGVLAATWIAATGGDDQPATDTAATGMAPAAPTAKLRAGADGGVVDDDWSTDYERALARAAREDKLVVVDFFAEWCGPCKMMDAQTFTDPRVRERLTDFVPLKIDVDRQRELATRFGIESLPTLAVLRPSGDPVIGGVGFHDVERFLALLDQAQERATAQTPSVETEPGADAGEVSDRAGALGAPAPELRVATWFNLPAERETVTLADHAGQVVYLYGFQSWCPGCHRHGFPTLSELIDHYQGDDRVAFLAVQTVFEGFDTNTPERALATAERYQLDIPVGHDGAPGTPSTLMRDYRTRGTPWTVIIDREGIVRYSDFHIEPARAVELIDGLLL